MRYLLWCGYAGSSLEVKIETDSNDAVEIKTEADCNDITEYSHVDRLSIGMFSDFSSSFAHIAFSLCMYYSTWLQLCQILTNCSCTAIATEL